MSAAPFLLFEGRCIDVSPHDTIAAALLRADVQIFSRGPKYHRPRGPYCLAGTCGQCHMRVGDEPNVPTCITPAVTELRVERQNVIGSGDRDLLRAVDFLFPGGLDHHHLNTRFRLLGAATQIVARRLAGIGQVPTAAVATVPARVRRERLVVIGAGPAGLSAAACAIERGLRPLVLEARARVGGWAIDGFSRDPEATAERLGALKTCVVQGGELALNARCVGIYREGGEHWLLVQTESGLWQIATEQVIVATGGFERPLPFESNDLPGIFAGRSLLRLVRDQAVRPGKRVVVVAKDADAAKVARGLCAAGIEVAALVGNAVPAPEDFPVVPGEPVRAIGRSRVSGLRVRDADGVEKTIKCDLIAVVGTRAPAYELAAEVGAAAHLSPAEGGFILSADADGATCWPWLRVAGTVAGRGGESVASGARAGRASG